MDVVLYDWPWVGLLAGLFGVAALLGWPRSAHAGSRWKDPSWLVCLMLPVYMLHQFEEHGINFLGQHYHFLTELCLALGHPDPKNCPGTPAFVVAVNCGGGVWIPGLLAILLRHRNVMVGACAMGIPLVNAIVHIGDALVSGHYNSGVVTAVVLFLPMCAWTLLQLRRNGLLQPRRLAAVIASGVLLHVTLAGSILGKEHDLWGEQLVLLINIFNFLIPFGLGTLVQAPSVRANAAVGSPA
jgi:hypothetical protein